MLKEHKLAEWAGERKVTTDLTPRVAADAEFRRVRATLYMACFVETIPRRLGGSADRLDLRLDKKAARQVQSCYLGLWQEHERFGTDNEYPAPAWNHRTERLKFGLAANSLQRRAGAIVEWLPWTSQRIVDLELRLAVLATIALRDDELAWGWCYCSMVEREASEIRRIRKGLEHEGTPTGKRETK